MGRDELNQKIVALAWKDDGFRKAFVADPKKQFEETLGTRLPPSLKMTVHEEDENSLHFVIPAKATPTGELPDADLEKVAGGIDTFTTVIISEAVVAAVIGIATQMNEANKGEGKEHW